MLADLRVLDLSSAVGLMCGQILADLGADVQQWIRPEDERLAATDAHWRAYTQGKGIHWVDWVREPDRLLAALESADVLIETRPRSFWEGLGLGDAEFEARFPELIRVAITHFGRSGPKSDFAATDLTSVAASGYLFVTGAAQAAPLRITVPQAHAHASADAAVGVLIALAERARSGLGQIVDVAAQESTTFALLSRGLDGVVGQTRAERAAYGAELGGVFIRNQFPARDGDAVVLQGILPPLAGFMERLMAWVHERGHIESRDLEHDWGQAAMQLATGQIAAADWARIESGIEALVAEESKDSLMREAIDHRLLVAPVFNLADVLDSDHFRVRHYIREGRGGRRLGAFARLPRSPLPLTENEPRTWTGKPNYLAPVARTFSGPEGGSEGRSTNGDEDLPLAGLRILDVFWVVAGPGATRMLADYGATVIHVESTRRIDMVRNVPPYVGGVTDPERASCHHTTNANKLNICLDLGSEEGREVLADLVRWADVFTESFAPGVIERMGFGYESVRKLKADIIMVSSSLMGQTGPWRDYAGYGNSAAAVTGFHGLVGQPGQPPTGCFGPYTDFLAVRFNALAILAALDHRARTGEGQWIDMSQSEAALHFLAPACLDWLREGTLAEPLGNRDPDMVPHGVFPTLGDDRWLALSVRSDEEWRTLCLLLDRQDLQMLSLEQRRARQDEIDATIADWSATFEGEVLEALLQERGIPAHVVLDTHDLSRDAQLGYREHFIEVAHKDFDGAAVESNRLRMSRTQPRRPQSAPWFGSHNRAVLEEILGYDDARIRSLESRGVMS